MDQQGRGKGKDSIRVNNGIVRTSRKDCIVENQNKLVLLDFHWCSWYSDREKKKIKKGS